MTLYVDGQSDSIIALGTHSSTVSQSLKKELAHENLKNSEGYDRQEAIDENGIAAQRGEERMKLKKGEDTQWGEEAREIWKSCGTYLRKG